MTKSRGEMTFEEIGLVLGISPNGPNRFTRGP